MSNRAWRGHISTDRMFWFRCSLLHDSTHLMKLSDPKPKTRLFLIVGDVYKSKEQVVDWQHHGLSDMNALRAWRKCCVARYDWQLSQQISMDFNGLTVSPMLIVHDNTPAEALLHLTCAVRIPDYLALHWVEKRDAAGRERISVNPGAIDVLAR